jgi:ABC-type amino acid transport substrate-binding protein
MALLQIKNLKKIIGTFDQTLFASSLEDRFPHSKIIGFHKRTELWAALKDGKIDTLYGDDLEIQKTKRENKDFDLYYKVQADNESSFPVAIALNQKNTQLAELLNLWIRNEESTGSLKRLCNLGAK